MDYSEFFISTKKKPDRPCPYSGRTRVELHVGHTHGSNNAPYSLLLGLCFSTHITFMLWLYDDCCVNLGSQTICTTPSARWCDKDFLDIGHQNTALFEVGLQENIIYLSLYTHTTFRITLEYYDVQQKNKTWIETYMYMYVAKMRWV